jgi:predicted Zn finger-like uncharacterized protein
MPTIIDCPSCRRQLRVPDNLGGQLVKCPTCGHTFTAPTDAGTRPVSGRPEPETYGVEPMTPEQRPAPPRERDRDRDRPSDFEVRHYERRHLAPHRGVLILVFGILSIVVCNLLGPVAWIMGNNDLAEIRAGRMDPEGEGLTQAGRIIGIVGTGLLVLSCVFGCLWIVIVGMAAGAGGFK